MKKWELASYLTGFLAAGEVQRIWKKDKETNLSDWDTLTKLALQGFELVSVTSVGGFGHTQHLLYTFKRPIEDGS